MHRPRRLSRRVFLADLGRGTFAAAVVGVGLTACSDDDADPTGEGDDALPAPTASATATATATAVATATATAAAPLEALRWERVPLGVVSAYVLGRGNEGAVVDTGTAGSAGDIEAALGALGLSWGAVGHVIATHAHRDHVGSLGAVLDLAPEAMAYAGAADIAAIGSPHAISAVGDGDRVFGLEVIATPGHTPGHISVLDPVAGLLLAGDALNGSGSGVVGPNPQFSSDLALANASVVKLAGHAFEAVVFGHGEPVTSGASALVAALAAEL